MRGSAPLGLYCSNRAARELLDDCEVELQTFHCPSTRPLAIFVTPKGGTTSAINWAVRMDEEIFDRVQYAGDLLAKGNPREVVHYMAGQLESDFPEVAPIEVHRKLADRLMHRYPEPERKKLADSFRLLPHAPYCPMCCAIGKNRLKVFVVRNPFVRLASFFKMKWLDGGDAEYVHGEEFRFSESWADFRSWVYMALSHRETRGGFTHALERFPENDRADNCHPLPECEGKGPEEVCGQVCTYRHFHFTASDVFHIRPIHDMLYDARYLSLVQNASVLTEGASMLHLETMQEDKDRIEKRLCDEYHDCDPLPEFPRVFPGTDETPSGKDQCQFNPRTAEYAPPCTVSWKELWSERLINAVVTHFYHDFELLGYKKTPFDVMPIGSS